LERWAWAGLLRENGHDAVGVVDQTLSGEDDPTVFEVCQDEDRELVTLDLDFAEVQAYPPEQRVSSFCAWCVETRLGSCKSSSGGIT